MHQGPRLRSRLRDDLYRTNPALEFLSVDRVTRDFPDVTEGLTDDSTCAGIVRERSSPRAGWKAIDHNTHELLACVRTASRLPASLLGAELQSLDESLARLVLDRILEIATPSGFAAGLAAYGVLFEDPAPELDADDTIGGLSRAAIDYGGALALDDAEQLAARLYFFNRYPVSPETHRLLRDAGGIQAWLQILPSQPSGALLDANWERLSGVPDEWLVWNARRRSSDRTTHKLYISPDFMALPGVMALLIELLSIHSCPTFKVGATAHAIQRPDKLVAYFSSHSELAACARALAVSCRGTRAHGVPFTAAFDGSGLLSWGVDPPSESHLLRWRESDSWRSWVTNRLATYLCQARREKRAGVPPARFAIDRLSLDGVDVQRWAPNERWLSGMMGRH